MLTNYPQDVINKFAKQISESSNLLSYEWNQPLYGDTILKPTRIKNTKDVILNPL